METKEEYITKMFERIRAEVYQNFSTIEQSLKEDIISNATLKVIERYEKQGITKYSFEGVHNLVISSLRKEGNVITESKKLRPGRPTLYGDSLGENLGEDFRGTTDFDKLVHNENPEEIVINLDLLEALEGSGEFKEPISFTGEWADNRRCSDRKSLKFFQRWG